MKPFDLEEAKKGAPVCTRGGRKARIICYDRESGNFPIIALIDFPILDSEQSERVVTYTLNGQYVGSQEHQFDLFMAEEEHYDISNFKPFDKVEPKFKVGDWVMLDRPVLITKVEDMPYNTHQYWTSDGTWFGDATKAKLWTIQDAKDGDVLDANGAPFIYKKHNKDYVYCYCGVNLSGDFIEAKGFDTWNNNYKVYPAAKEQRNLLFQKMKKAGYTWDAEKKELTKIEDEPENYNPYKEVVESIAEMCKHYDKASHSSLRDFYDNVKVKCKDAKEYDSLFPQNA